MYGIYSQQSNISVLNNYVVIGTSINTRIASSPDGINWTSQSTTGNFNDVIWGGGKFIAIGSSVCYTSTDSITWTAQTIPAGTYQKIIYANGLYVAVSSLGSNRISTSTDGINWTSRLTTNTFYDVIWDGSKFIAVGTNCRTSTDGINWTAQTIPSGEYLKVIYNGSIYVAVGTNGTYKIVSSTDGINWTSRLTAGNFNDVIWDGSKFIAVGASVCRTSTDGINWTSQTIPGGTYNKIIYANGLYVAVSSGGTNRIITSTNGTSWTSRLTASVFYDVIYDGSKFIAIGNNVCFTSTDGITWTLRTIPSGNYRKITYNT